MQFMSKQFRLLLALLVLATVMLWEVPPAQAQEQGVSAIVRSSDMAAGNYAVSTFRYRITPANTKAGAMAVGTHALGSPFPATFQTMASTIAQVPAPGFYPSDLVYFGGAVVKSLQSHDIFVNCTDVAVCWGHPGMFLSDLGKSNFIHVLDQYVRSTANDRYTLGTSLFTSYSLFAGENVISLNALLGIVHAAVRTLGPSFNGYGHIYHVFLPKGVDTCFDLSTTCYSPDNPSTFVFCAYHGSVTYSDIGHVLLSVEPYQNVAGCQAAPPNPNSLLVDSTNSVLSHELSESITDPDSASWISFSSLDTAGFEIGDLCQPLVNKAAQFLLPTLTLNGHKYELQLEYSNRYHACAPGP